MSSLLLVVMVLSKLACSVPVNEHVRFRQQDFDSIVGGQEDEVERSLLEYLDWYYDEYVDRNKNEIAAYEVEDAYEGMQSDQPASDFGPLSSLFANLSSMVNLNKSYENQSDIEYIRTMRNRRDSKTDDRTKDTWIQILKDNILRQVGRVNTTLLKPKDKVDMAGLNVSNLFPAGQILDDEYVTEKIRSYYPSCELPKNTDQDLWKDESVMNLYFNVEYPDSGGVTIATATLRLYRTPAANGTGTGTGTDAATNADATSCENSSDEQLMRVSIYWYTKSLKKQRVKRRLSDSKVVGDNSKWVELSVLPATKAWVKGKNLGLAVIVEDQEGSLLKADKYFKGATCMVGTSTPKPIPTVIVDAARWANELERVNGNSGRGTSATVYNNLLLLPTIDVCTLEFPQNATRDAASLSSWRNACDFKRVHARGQKLSERERSTANAGNRHIRHQKQHMHDFGVDPRSRMVGQKVVMTNEELRNLNARLMNGTYSNVNR